MYKAPPTAAAALQKMLVFLRFLFNAGMLQEFCRDSWLKMFDKPFVDDLIAMAQSRLPETRRLLDHLEVSWRQRIAPLRRVLFPATVLTHAQRRCCTSSRPAAPSLPEPEGPGGVVGQPVHDGGTDPAEDHGAKALQPDPAEAAAAATGGAASGALPRQARTQVRGGADQGGARHRSGQGAEPQGHYQGKGSSRDPASRAGVAPWDASRPCGDCRVSAEVLGPRGRPLQAPCARATHEAPGAHGGGPAGV